MKEPKITKSAFFYILYLLSWMFLAFAASTTLINYLLNLLGYNRTQDSVFGMSAETVLLFAPFLLMFLAVIAFYLLKGAGIRYTVRNSRKVYQTAGTAFFKTEVLPALAAFLVPLITRIAYLQITSPVMSGNQELLSYSSVTFAYSGRYFTEHGMLWLYGRFLHVFCYLFGESQVAVFALNLFLQALLIGCAYLLLRMAVNQTAALFFLVISNIIPWFYETISVCDPVHLYLVQMVLFMWMTSWICGGLGTRKKVPEKKPKSEENTAGEKTNNEKTANRGVAASRMAGGAVGNAGIQRSGGVSGGGVQRGAGRANPGMQRGGRLAQGAGFQVVQISMEKIEAERRAEQKGHIKEAFYGFFMGMMLLTDLYSIFLIIAGIMLIDRSKKTRTSKLPWYGLGFLIYLLAAMYFAVLIRGWSGSIEGFLMTLPDYFNSYVFLYLPLPDAWSQFLSGTELISDPAGLFFGSAANNLWLMLIVLFSGLTVMLYQDCENESLGLFSIPYAGLVLMSAMGVFYLDSAVFAGTLTFLSLSAGVGMLMEMEHPVKKNKKSESGEKEEKAEDKKEEKQPAAAAVQMPVGGMRPIERQIPAAEQKPAVSPVLAAEQKPAVSPVPAAEQKPAVSPVPAAEQKPAESIVQPRRSAILTGMSQFELEPDMPEEISKPEEKAEPVVAQKPEEPVQPAVMQKAEEPVRSAAVQKPAEPLQPAAEPKVEKPVQMIENPLPLPKKHEHKEMDYQYNVPEDKMHYDIQVPDSDDFDIKY